MKHIKEFDGLRGLLALWVFVAHAVEFGPYWSATRHVHANWAVDIFIILSGFVIFHLLRSGEDYGTFNTRRWFRLFPVFALCFLLALALYSGLGIEDSLAFGIGRQEIAPYLVTHAVMLHGAVPNEVLPHSAQAILPPAWSISVEWQFYLLAPLLFIFVARPNWKAALIVGSLVAMRILYEAGQLGLLWPGLPRALTFDMNAFLPLKLEFFAVGAACYQLWRWLGKQDLLIIPSWWYAVMISATVLGGLLSPAIFLWFIAFAFVVRANFGARSALATRVVGVLNRRSMQFLGRISYPLYLLHLPVIILLREIIRTRWPELSSVQFASLLAGLALPVSVGGAWLIHVLVERPMIHWGKRLSQARKPHLAAAVNISAAANG
jgi:peptidoglycan/LPS O-acetylase OafA/YrhL